MMMKVMTVLSVMVLMMIMSVKMDRRTSFSFATMDDERAERSGSWWELLLGGGVIAVGKFSPLCPPPQPPFRPSRPLRASRANTHLAFSTRSRLREKDGELALFQSQSSRNH